LRKHTENFRENLYFSGPLIFRPYVFLSPSPHPKCSLFWKLNLKKAFRQVGKFRTTAKWISKNGFEKYLCKWCPFSGKGQPPTLPRKAIRTPFANLIPEEGATAAAGPLKRKRRPDCSGRQ